MRTRTRTTRPTGGTPAPETPARAFDFTKYSVIHGLRPFDRNGNTNPCVMIDAPDSTSAILPMPLDKRGRALSDGFEWGYHGQGPYALAVALLMLAHGIAPGSDHEAAFARLRVSADKLKRELVAKFPAQGEFRLERARLENMARLAACTEDEL